MRTSDSKELPLGKVSEKAGSMRPLRKRMTMKLCVMVETRPDQSCAPAVIGMGTEGAACDHKKMYMKL